MPWVPVVVFRIRHEWRWEACGAEMVQALRNERDIFFGELLIMMRSAQAIVRSRNCYVMVFVYDAAKTMMLLLYLWFNVK